MESDSSLPALDPFVFKIAELAELGERGYDAYRSAQPFPHAVFDDFLPAQVARRALDLFPAADSQIWLDWTRRDTVHQPRKQGIGHAERLEGVAPWLQALLSAFNSYPFLNFLQKLTGVQKLLPDPHFHGGGLHQILSGGKLAVHTDFNDLASLDLYRRINVLFYLNQDWRDDYCGDLELWAGSPAARMKSIAPLFNRLVVFDTNKKTLHGHPEPLQTPPEVTRKSIALYYYTARPAPDEHYDGQTDWQDS